jgi:hypothetical protein
VAPLRERLAALLDLPIGTSSSVVVDRLWTLTGGYSIGDEQLTYVLDEVGSRLQLPLYGDAEGAAFRYTSMSAFCAQNICKSI